MPSLSQQPTVGCFDGIRKKQKIQQLANTTKTQCEEHHHAIANLTDIDALNTTNPNK